MRPWQTTHLSREQLRLTSKTLRSESPIIIASHLFLAAFIVVWGSGQAPDSAPASLLCDVSFLFSLHSSEAVLQGHLIFLLQVLAIAGSHSATLLLPLPSVHASGGGFGCLAMGCGSAANCTWKQPSNSTEPAIQLLLSHSYAMQSSHSCLQLSHLPQELLHLTDLWQAGLLPFPAPEETSIRFLQSQFCTAVSPAALSAWRHWPLSGQMVQVAHQSCSLCSQMSAHTSALGVRWDECP